MLILSTYLILLLTVMLSNNHCNFATENFRIKDLKIDDIERVLFFLNKTAPGSDGINLDMLKLAFPKCGEALLHLLNTTLELRDIPVI